MKSLLGALIGGIGRNPPGKEREKKATSYYVPSLEEGRKLSRREFIPPRRGSCTTTFAFFTERRRGEELFKTSRL